MDVTILQDDGSISSACITAATMALADARVELLDLVSSCTVAMVIALDDDDNNNNSNNRDDNDNNNKYHQHDAPQRPMHYLADPSQLELSRAHAVSNPPFQ